MEMFPISYEFKKSNSWSLLIECLKSIAIQESMPASKALRMAILDCCKIELHFVKPYREPESESVKPSS